MGHQRPSQLYAIADVAFCAARGLVLEEIVVQAVSGGAKMLSVRVGGAMKGRDEAQRVALWGQVERAVRQARQGGAEVLLHAHIERAAEFGCGGVHLKASQAGEVGAARQALGMGARVGVSCHSLAEARLAEHAGADFVTLSPIFESLSKPGYGGDVELERWARILEAIKVPTYALGGVLPEHVERCVAAGFCGVAVVGGLFGAEDVAGAARRYVDALARA